MTVQQLNGTVSVIAIEYCGHEIEIYDVEFEGTYTHDPGTRYYPDGSGDPPWSECEVWIIMSPRSAAAQVKLWVEEDMGWFQRWWRSWFQLYDGEAIIELINEQLDKHVSDSSIEDYL